MYLSNSDIHTLIDFIRSGEQIDRQGYCAIFSGIAPEQYGLMKEAARETTDIFFGRKIYVRGLIEISNHCKNNCFYCGIRCSNKSVDRYRLEKDEILECCRKGSEAGFRSFVLQGGEDPVQNDEWITGLVKEIKSEFPEHAVTLSVGEKDYRTYKMFKDAGADRYLLRHETANAIHYSALHPKSMTLDKRVNCLRILKTLGFQTGAGIMVGSPFQTTECLADDMMLFQKLEPEMIGIGPFIPANGTPFSDYPTGNSELTLLILAILRMRFPKVLMPATTALTSLSEDGRIKGLMAGANVIMPNLSPVSVRNKYTLYRNKLSSGNEAAEQIDKLGKSLDKAGFEIDFSRGDYPDYQENKKKNL